MIVILDVIAFIIVLSALLVVGYAFPKVVLLIACAILLIAAIVHLYLRFLA